MVQCSTIVSILLPAHLCSPLAALHEPQPQPHSRASLEGSGARHRTEDPEPGWGDLSLIKASIVQNIQRMLSAVEVTDFTVAEITEYSVACQDGTLDLSRETDVDCGGDDTRCVRCDGGLKCETDSDCLSLQCDNLVCAAPRKLRRNEWFVSE